MKTMGKREQILNEAESLFTKDILQELEEWYEYTLQDEWHYVVFAVRRSYMMALIMECITEKKMNDSSPEFLTDAALFLRCGELAASYRRRGVFPRILLCDDVMIHGRSMNHIIEGLLQELYRLLEGEFERNEIKMALVKAVSIHVYTRTTDHLLLIGSYTWKLHCTRKESPNFWHQLSNDISSLIFRSDLTNACYIYTEHMSDEQMEKIKEKNETMEGFIQTVYQRIWQYTRLEYLPSARSVKGVLSLRLIKNDYYDGYRAAPLIFLPNMGAAETESVSEIILEKLPEDYRAWFLGWKEMAGKRTFNEFVTLLLSDAILKEFNRKYDIQLNPVDKDQELDKLVRNYNQYGVEPTKQMLNELLGEDQRSVLSMEDMERIIKALSAKSDLMMELTESPKKPEKQNIRKRVEDYFYSQGRADEISAHELVELPYFPTKRRSERRVRNSSQVLKELNRGYTQQESQYCMAFFLHMIDAGIGGLSSYAPNDTEVAGYAQFVKAGEQSLLLEPLRKYKYIPMLSWMQHECNRLLRDLTNEVREFGWEAGWEESLIDMLTAFIGSLEEIGQTPWDWDGNYVRKVDGDIEVITGLIKEQSALRKAYADYARAKYWNRKRGR